MLILVMFSGLGQAQDLVEGLGCILHALGLQQDIVPGFGRKTYPGCRGLGCDYLLYINQSYVRGSDLFSSSFDLCNILFTNHVSRMKERNIFQKIIGTSHIGLINKQYICQNQGTTKRVPLYYID